MRPVGLTLALAAVAAITAGAASAASPSAEPRTEAAVRDASDDWLAAAKRGDVAELDRRVMPEYRDIEPNGRIHFRPEQMARVAALKNPSTVPLKELAAEFRKAHPAIEKVVISGDTALLSYHAADPQASDDVLSMDVFVYNEGRWRALASIHLAHS